MPDTQNKDQEREDLEQKYQDSPDQDEVDRGIEEAEDFANQESDQPQENLSGGENNDELDFYKQSPDSESFQTNHEGGSKIAGSLASSTNPASKITGVASRMLGFTKQHKKGVIAGGSVLGALLSIGFFIATSLPGLQLVWMSSVLTDFNFGPHHRNVVNRVDRIRGNFDRIRNNDTDMGRQTDDIYSNRRSRLRDLDSKFIKRSTTRFQFRRRIQTKINTARPSGDRFRWKIFEGRSRSSSDYTYPGRKIRGTDSPRSNMPGTHEEYREAAQEVRQSENPRQAAKSRARGIVKGSLVLGVVALGCMPAIAEETVPDEKERYLISMSKFANVITAGSQVSSGEDSHGDEVADAMDPFSGSDTVPNPGEEEGEVNTDDIESTTPEGEDSNQQLAKEESLESSELQNALSDSESRERKESFSNSAAWKRNTNQAVDGDEKDSDTSYTAQNSFLPQAVLTIGGALNKIPGFSSACRAISHPLIVWPMTILEGVAAVISAWFTGGVGPFAKFAVSEAVFEATSYLIANLAYDRMVPANAEQLYAQVDMGGNMANSENARYQGAPPVSSDEMNEKRDRGFRKFAKKDKEKGFVWRYFSPDNPRSLFARTAMSMRPITMSRAANFFTNFSAVTSTITSSTLQIVTPVTADSHLENFDNYDIQQFAYSDETIENINPARNDKTMSATQGYECEARGVMHKSEPKNINGPRIIPSDQFEDGRAETPRSIVYADEGIYYDFHEIENPEKSCDLARWFDAELMEFQRRVCMKNPYYEQIEDGRDHPLNDLYDLNEWEWSDYGGGYSGELERGDVVEVGPGQGFNPIIHTTECRYPLGINKTAANGYDAPHFNTSGYRPPYVRSQFSDQLEFWKHYGIWRLDNDIIDNTDCMTHDDSCGQQLGEGVGDSDSPPPSDPPDGDASSLATKILNNDNIGADPKPRGQLQQVAEGDTELLDSRLLAVVSNLGQENEFTLTSLDRNGPCSASRHNCGFAADFSGSRGINGESYDYSGYSETVQNFVDEAANTLGADCEIGLPNQTYVNSTRPEAHPSCDVFVDKGTAPHIHIAVSPQ